MENRKLEPNRNHEHAYGLVLGGGGSKGCYHVGVWQAMNEAGITFDSLTGTSIGALVGIFYPGNNIGPVTDFVMEMQPTHVAQDLPRMPSTLKETVQGGRTVLNFLKKYYESRMDITPLREQFDEMFDYDSFKNSPVRYACMTWNDTKQEPEAFFKGQITRENAREIVMASSACYPAFPKVELNGQTYMDGMYADNVPIALMKQLMPDADRIVVVDLHDPGEPTPPALTDDMFYIQPILKPGHPLDFSREHAEKLYRQGYLDTRRYLGQNPGYIYTFAEEDKDLIDVVEDYLARQLTQMNVILPDHPALQEHVFRTVLGYTPAPLSSPFMEHYELGQFVEALALLARVDPEVCYDYRDFLRRIVSSLSKQKTEDHQRDEFLLVELLSSVYREESVWLMYRLIRNGNGHLPVRAAALKDRFPVSYILAYIRYFIEILVEQLDGAVPAEAKKTGCEQTAGSEGEASGKEETEKTGIHKIELKPVLSSKTDAELSDLSEYVPARKAQQAAEDTED